MGGKADDIASAVAVDPQGDAVVVGSFSYQLELGDAAIKSRGADDIFVAKLAPDGRRLWAQGMGGLDVDGANGVAVDRAGDVAVIGSYKMDIKLGTDTHIAEGDTDIVLALLGPDGTLRWSKAWGAIGADEGRAVAFDAAGNLYALVEFSREVDFGGGKLVSAGNRDIGVIKLDPSGKHIWSRRFGAQLDELAVGLAVDPTGGVAATGSFDDVLDVGDGAPMRTAGRSDVFVLELAADGRTRWAQRLGDKDEDIGACIAVDRFGTVYVGGWFWRQLQHGATVLKSSGKKDLFVAAFGPSGQPIWARSFGQKEEDFARGLAVDDRAVYLVGTFEIGIDVGGTALASATPPGSPLPWGDVLVAKFER
jgi:hypothetical protein